MEKNLNIWKARKFFKKRFRKAKFYCKNIISSKFMSNLMRRRLIARVISSLHKNCKILDFHNAMELFTLKLQLNAIILHQNIAIVASQKFFYV